MAQIRLGEALVQAGLIDEYQLKSALGQQRRWGGRLGKALIDLGFIDEATLLSFLSEKLKFSAVDLSRSKIAPKTFAAVPKRIAEKYMVVPILIKDTPGKKTLVLAMADPTDLKAIDEIEFLTNYRIEPVVALESSIKKVIQRYGIPDGDTKEEENVGVALEEAPHGRVEIVHGELDQMIEVQKQYGQKSEPLPPSAPSSSVGQVKIEGEEEFDLSSTRQEDGEWLGEKEESEIKQQEPDKLEFVPTSEDEVSAEADVIEEAEPIEDTEAVEEVPEEAQPEEGELSAEVRIAQTLEDAAKFYEDHKGKSPPPTVEPQTQQMEQAETDTPIEEAEICEPCDEEPREEPLSGASYIAEGELQGEEVTEAEAYAGEVAEEITEDIYSSQSPEEIKDEYEYEAMPETESGEESNEGLAVEAIAEEVQEGATTIVEPVAETEAVEDVYEAEPVETYSEEYVEEAESDVVTAVVEEAEDNALLMELRLLREQIADLKKQIEGLIMLFVLKEEGKISLIDFLKEIKNL